MNDWTPARSGPGPVLGKFEGKIERNGSRARIAASLVATQHNQCRQPRFRFAVNQQHAIATPNTHPRAGQTLSGADTIVQVLADEGVDVVFGYSGGAILPTYDAIFRYNQERVGRDDVRPMPLIVPANEQGAAFMAAGYARASGRVGVCLVTSGPGATNTVTPVRDCAADSVPIVVICGQVPRPAIGTDAFQEAPVANIMGAVAKHCFLVTDPERLEATVRTAFEISRTGRPGPVVIDVPKDVQNWQGPFRGSGQLPVRGYRQRMAALNDNALDEQGATEFFGMLGRAERPLVYAGGGVIHGNAAQALRRLAIELELPVVTTLMGIGAMDTSHPLSMRMLGMHGAAFANYAVDDCDFLIAVGARFDDRVAGAPERFAHNAKWIAHLDVDASEIGKVKRVQWSHVGLLPAALEALRSHAARAGFRRDRSPWHAHLDDLRRMLDRQAVVGAAKTLAFVRKDVLVAHENDFDVEFLRGLKGALDARGWAMVSAHGVESNFHSCDVLIRGGCNRCRCCSINCGKSLAQ